VALQSMTALKSMTLEKLMNLKSDVEAMLAQKVSEQRHSLEQELSKLGGYTGGAAVIHSPAEITAAWPTTVTRSRCPLALTRMTRKPLSAFW
jgi:hypothetical protein